MDKADKFIIGSMFIILFGCKLVEGRHAASIGGSGEGTEDHKDRLRNQQRREGVTLPASIF
ncbi:MAG: hypothetical protein JRE20_13535 [Deltaproteobacteria bacterium]|nr:hypothetical protein [Deltaproteobacteria bacterium]